MQHLIKYEYYYLFHCQSKISCYTVRTKKVWIVYLSGLKEKLFISCLFKLVAFLIQLTPIIISWKNGKWGQVNEFRQTIIIIRKITIWFENWTAVNEGVYTWYHLNLFGVFEIKSSIYIIILYVSWLKKKLYNLFFFFLAINFWEEKCLKTSNEE